MVATISNIIVRLYRAQRKLNQGYRTEQTLISSSIQVHTNRICQTYRNPPWISSVSLKNTGAQLQAWSYGVSHILSACTVCAHIDFYPRLSWNSRQRARVLKGPTFFRDEKVLSYDADAILTCTLLFYSVTVKVMCPKCARCGVLHVCV